MPPNTQNPNPEPISPEPQVPGAVSGQSGQPGQPVYQQPTYQQPVYQQPPSVPEQPAVPVQPTQPAAYGVPAAPSPHAAQPYTPNQQTAGTVPGSMPYSAPAGMQTPPAPAYNSGYPANSFAAPSSGGTRKKLFLGVGAAVAVLLLGVGGVFALNALQKISPEQYRTASDAASNTSSKLSSMSLEVSSISYELDSTDTQFNNQLDKAKKTVADFKTAHKDLSKQKALHDKDAKKLYKAYADKESKYITFVDGYVDSISTLGPVLVRCSNTIKDATEQAATTASADALDACANDLKNVKGLKDKDVQDFATANQDGISQLAGIVRQTSSLGSSDYAKRSQLLNQLYDVEDSVGKRVDDISSTLDKKMTENVPTDELHQLSNKLFDKSLAAR